MTYGVRMGPSGSAEKWRSKRWFVPRGLGSTGRKLQTVRFLLTRDRSAVLRFLAARYPIDFPILERVALLRQFAHITHEVRGYHTLAEILAVCDQLFHLAGRPGLTLVECGAGSGSSTAKLSLAAKKAGARLVVFDSFRGIPENDERHHLLDGRELVFLRGAFKGRLTTVKKRVETLGAIDVCTFHKGLFSETLPSFTDPVDVVLLDVDLASSTRECTAHFFPRLRAGGALFSQDGHLQATVDLYRDPSFWRCLGVEPPSIEGLGRDKHLRVPR
ncbi:class I SAM-dependent methyltransferase [Myxococcota bacterium]|nr:class I SAM-dependent methyltransferase [Myxococcota bacterium]